MTKQELEEKREGFLDKIVELQTKDIHEEVEAEVAAFRAELVEKYKRKRDEAINKIENYIELLDELLTAEKEAEEKVNGEQGEATEENEVAEGE